MFATKFHRQSDDYKICVVMVGLPARGKSLIAGKGTLSESLLRRLHRPSYTIAAAKMTGKKC